MEADAVDIFVLNHNGCALLAECLDSVVRAAESSRYTCRVVVVDNTSSDDSRHWLAQHSPTVEVWSYPNDGLISLNAAVARSSAPVVVLLNNDIRLSEDALDPLVAPLVYSAPIQLLAYHVAVHKGADVDQPRNLAKSVTVE